MQSRTKPSEVSVPDGGAQAQKRILKMELNLELKLKLKLGLHSSADTTLISLIKLWTQHFGRKTPRGVNSELIHL